MRNGAGGASIPRLTNCPRPQAPNRPRQRDHDREEGQKLPAPIDQASATWHGGSASGLGYRDRIGALENSSVVTLFEIGEVVTQRLMKPSPSLGVGRPIVITTSEAPMRTSATAHDSRCVHVCTLDTRRGRLLTH